MPEGLGQRLRALRTARGWSQRKLAVEAGLTRSQVAKFEADASAPRAAALAALALALGTSLDLLVTGQERAPVALRLPAEVVAAAGHLAALPAPERRFVSRILACLARPRDEESGRARRIAGEGA